VLCIHIIDLPKLYVSAINIGSSNLGAFQSWAEDSFTVAFLLEDTHAWMQATSVVVSTMGGGGGVWFTNQMLVNDTAHQKQKENQQSATYAMLCEQPCMKTILTTERPVNTLHLFQQI
jgi:hypothetical protein